MWLANLSIKRPVFIRQRRMVVLASVVIGAISYSILVVDLANRIRLQGVDLKEAILTAGPLRLRPVLMTTFALVFGMLPVALGLGAGSELRSPMAITVIGGLITSTLLTLVVVPVIYSIVESLKLRLMAPKRETLPVQGQ